MRNDVDMRLIERIKTDRLVGKSLAAIAASLNTAGIRGSAGGQFYAGTVDKVLRHTILRRAVDLAASGEHSHHRPIILALKAEGYPDAERVFGNRDAREAIDRACDQAQKAQSKPLPGAVAKMLTSACCPRARR